MVSQNDSEGLIPLEHTGQTAATGSTTNTPVSPASPAPPYQPTIGSVSAPGGDYISQTPTEKTQVADDIAPTFISSSKDDASTSYPGQPKGESTAYNSPDDVKGYPGQPQPTYQDPSQQAPNYQQAQAQPGVYYTPYGPPSGYASATPLHALQSASAPVDCPSCGHREMTRTESVTGMTTHGWAAVLCCCCCLGCFPYLMSSLKDVDHYCGKCGVKLACWHNSGRVQIMQTGSAQPSQQVQPGQTAETPATQ